jgi:hypothetical protein
LSGEPFFVRQYAGYLKDVVLLVAQVDVEIKFVSPQKILPVSAVFFRGGQVDVGPEPDSSADGFGGTRNLFV